MPDPVLASTARPHRQVNRSIVPTTGWPTVAALLLVACACPAFAQVKAAPAPPAPTNDDCMTCHADPATTRANGQPVAVDPKAFAASVHGQIDLNCVDCHADLAKVELPHAEKLAPVDCATCHEDAVAQFKKSVHAQARAAGNTVAAACVSCHGIHDILKPDDPNSSVNPKNLLVTCQKCHPGVSPNWTGAWTGHYQVSLKRTPFLFYVDSFYSIFTPLILWVCGIYIALQFIRFMVDRVRRSL